MYDDQNIFKIPWLWSVIILAGFNLQKHYKSFKMIHKRVTFLKAKTKICTLNFIKKKKKKKKDVKIQKEQT